MSDAPSPYPEFLPLPEDEETKFIEEYLQEQEKAKQGTGDAEEEIYEPEVQPMMREIYEEPSEPVFTQAELVERGKHLNYFRIAKSKFPTLWGALNVSDKDIEAYSIEDLRKLRTEYELVRNHRNGYDMFLLMAKNATFVFEKMIAPMIGLELEGLHFALMNNQEYQDALAHIAHDNAISNMTPVQRLLIIVGLTAYDIHMKNSATKQLAPTLIKDVDESLFADV